MITIIYFYRFPFRLLLFPVWFSSHFLFYSRNIQLTHSLSLLFFFTQSDLFCFVESVNLFNCSLPHISLLLKTCLCNLLWKFFFIFVSIFIVLSFPAIFRLFSISLLFCAFNFSTLVAHNFLVFCSTAVWTTSKFRSRNKISNKIRKVNDEAKVYCYFMTSG